MTTRSAVPISCKPVGALLTGALLLWMPVAQAAGMLTRDARAKERKKPGLKRARKAKQYTKR